MPPPTLNSEEPENRRTRACLGRCRALRPGSTRERVDGRHARPPPHRRHDRPVGIPARCGLGSPETPRAVGAGPVVLACAWAGHRLAAHIPLRVFEPLVVATTIVATLPLLV